MAMGLIWAPGPGSLCIHSLIPQILFITCYVLDMVLGTGNMIVSTNNHSPCPHGVFIPQTKQREGLHSHELKPRLQQSIPYGYHRAKSNIMGKAQKWQNSLASRRKDLGEWPWGRKNRQLQQMSCYPHFISLKTELLKITWLVSDRDRISTQN